MFRIYWYYYCLLLLQWDTLLIHIAKALVRVGMHIESLFYFILSSDNCCGVCEGEFNQIVGIWVI